MDRVRVLLVCLVLATVVAIGTSLYVRRSLLTAERFAGPAERMYAERLKTAIVDGFQSKLKRQPTAQEVEDLTEALREQLRGASLRKEDLAAVVASLIDAKHSDTKKIT